MDGQGMVAVVRGLGDSQLAVTVLDSGKQYTLLPTSELHPANQRNERSSSTNTPSQQYHQSQCHVAAQASDGQYASVYKTTHCKVRPTSPPVQLTEFPPQRAAVAPGHGNFEVGGTGSGDTSFNCLRATGTYRGGGMVWPDKGCVCSPRASRQPDAFAESLRKYPALSPERSAEIVERLVNYSQAKNFAKFTRQSSLSPSRISAEQNDRSPSRESRRCRVCELEKTRYRIQGESPTKDRPTKTARLESDGEARGTFSKSYDVRHVKDMSKKLKEPLLRCNPCMSHCPSIRESFELMKHHPAVGQKPTSRGGHSETSSGNRIASMAPLMVNSQTQAAASINCKEVSTAPRHKMITRNVAVPLSPQPSDVSHPEGAVFDFHPLLLQASVQTLVIPIPVTDRKSVQTTQSSIDIPNVKINKSIKKFRSEIALSNREVREDIICWLVEVLHSAYSKNLSADVIDKIEENIRSVSDDFGGEEAKLKLMVESINDDSSKNNLQDICDELVNKARVKNKYHTQIYRAEVLQYRASEDLKRAIKDWLLELPMKTRDCSGKYIDEEQLLTNFMKRLKKVLFSPDYDIKKLRNDIVKILKDIPIACGSTNQIVYLNKLANNLIKKLLNANCYLNTNQSSKSEVENKTSKKTIQLNETDIRDLVTDEIIDFLNTFNIKLSFQRLQDLEMDIFGRIVGFLNNMRLNNKERFIDEVVHAMQGIGAFEYQASYFAHLVLNHLKKLLKKEESSDQDPTRRLHMTTVLNSSVNETSENSTTLTDGYIQKNMDSYMQQLTQQIDEWLAGLELEIPWSQDEIFRQVVVNDLTEDIVDRHKYLKLNNYTISTEKDELEYLKYLIFKWINKLVGEDHERTKVLAPELLKRIRSVPMPSLINYYDTHNSKLVPPESNQKAIFEPPEEIMQPQACTFSPSMGYCVSRNIQAFPVPIAGPSRIKNPTTTIATGAADSNMGKGLEGFRIPNPGLQNIHTRRRLNEIYDSFVRKWVETVPIPVYTPEESALAATMRTGLYNGIFQIVTKLRFQPQLMFNPFFYQDALDEELEELLSLLPQTPEFLKKKNILKALMIERTTELNELIKMISSPAYKERMVNEYHNYIPKFSTDLSKECPIRLYEELQILNIAEDFLLSAKFKEEDPLIAYMYRQKLTERIREFVNEMKQIQGKELKDINPDEYINQVMEALQQVPLPSEGDMSEEMDELLLGYAIDEWYMALPLAHNNNVYEQLKRRHLRDALTKKIQNIEKSMIASGNTLEYELKNEISRFLEKIPLGKEESQNINDMVDELVHKVKNIVNPKPEVAALHDTMLNYNDFGDNVALHSTTIQVPDGYRLVGPLPPCCASGLDQILAQPGPSGLQIQTPSGAGQNFTQSGLTDLKRHASMIGGGTPLKTTQSYGQHSLGGPRQSLSPADLGVKSQGLTQQPSAHNEALETQNFIENTRNEERQRQNSLSESQPQNRADTAAVPEGTYGQTSPGVTNITQKLSDNSRNTERRTSFQAQATQETSHSRPSSLESGNIQNVSGLSSGQIRSRMGELDCNIPFKNISESDNIPINLESDSASELSRPRMSELDYSSHSVNMSNSCSAKGQRKPSMGLKENITNTSHKKMTTKDTKLKNALEQRQTSKDMLGNNTQSQSTHIQTSTENPKHLDGQRQCSRNTAECKVGGSESGTSRLPSQSKLCICKKAKAEKVNPVEGKKCIFGLCSNAETMTKTKPWFCKGSKHSFCPVVNKRTLVSKNIETSDRQTSSQAVSNTDGSSSEGRLGINQTTNTDFSVVGHSGKTRYFQQHKPGNKLDYDIQITEGSIALISEHSLTQPQEPIQKSSNTRDEEAKIDKKHDSRVMRGHVPGSTHSAQLPQQAVESRMPSAARTGHSSSGKKTRDIYTTNSTGVQTLQPSLAPSGQRRRVSIISPQSQERLMRLSESTVDALNHQDDFRAQSRAPENQTLIRDNVGTYQGFVGGRPRSSSLQEQTIADQASVEQDIGYVQSRVDSSMPIRIQSSLIEDLDPILLTSLQVSLNDSSLNNTAAPQWITFPESDMSGSPCVCPPYVSMLSPAMEQAANVSSGLDANEMFAPGQMFDQMTRPDSPGTIYRPVTGQSQFQQAPQSQFQQAQQRLISQPQNSINRPFQKSINQPRQAIISQPRQGSISQQINSSISQLRQGNTNQPRQGRLSQSQQSNIPLSISQDPRFISPGVVRNMFPHNGRHTMQMNEQEISMLMQTIPPESQTVQSNMRRQISMPNRSQFLQDTSLEGRQPGAVKGLQLDQITSMVEQNVQSVQEENEPDRSSRAFMPASFSQSMQSRSRRGLIRRSPPDQVPKIRQQSGSQRMSRNVSGGMQRRESAWQSTGQRLTPQNVTSDSNIQQMDAGEASSSQADKRASQAQRRPTQNAAAPSAGWQSFRQITPQTAQQVQDTVYQELSQSGRRTSRNRSTAGEPVSLNLPSISANQLSFQQQADPSLAIQGLVDQGPVGVSSPSNLYHRGGQEFQNDITVAGFIPGQPVQVVQDPRAYTEPAAFSTPQRPIPNFVPQGPIKTGRRRPIRREVELDSSELDQGNFDEGKVNLSDSDSDRGPRFRCRCYERLKRFRRRRERYEDECDIPCPYAHYYYTCF